MKQEPFIKLSELHSLKDKLGNKLIKQRDEDGVIGIEEAVTTGQIVLVDSLIAKAQKTKRK